MGRHKKQLTGKELPRYAARALSVRILFDGGVCWLRHAEVHRRLAHMLDQYGVLKPEFKGVYTGTLRKGKSEIDGTAPGSLKHRLFCRLMDHLKKNRNRRGVEVFKPDIQDWGLDKKCHQRFGFTLDEYIAHVEKLFTDGMTWDRVLKGDIQIDHEFPVRIYNLTTDTGIKAAYGLANTKPMWRGDNARKGRITDLWLIALFGEGTTCG